MTILADLNLLTVFYPKAYEKVKDLNTLFMRISYSLLADKLLIVNPRD